MSATLQTWRQFGFVPEAGALAQPECVAPALADAPLFDAAVSQAAETDSREVPYFLTDAIRRLALDPAVVDVARTLLCTDRWVMWGANIRRSVPNEAQLWHADLESVLWPSVTVAVGLTGCCPDGGTWFLPGSHAIGRGPGSLIDDCADTAGVVARARTLTPGTGEPRQVEGFGDGRFYVFNGRCWHKADEGGAGDKVVLYLHYQRADDKRIPLMVDYERHLWSREACPYMAAPGAEPVRTAVYSPPLRHRIGRWLHRARGR